MALVCANISRTKGVTVYEVNDPTVRAADYEANQTQLMPENASHVGFSKPINCPILLNHNDGTVEALTRLFYVVAKEKPQ